MLGRNEYAGVDSECTERERQSIWEGFKQRGGEGCTGLYEHEGVFFLQPMGLIDVDLDSRGWVILLRVVGTE